MEITKDMIIGDLLEAKPEAAEILLSMGMHCLGCPSARGETIGQACEVHGVDVDEILDEINAL
jgi:hybrid cluster-associated redox disulfide protein